MRPETRFTRTSIDASNYSTYSRKTSITNHGRTEMQNECNCGQLNSKDHRLTQPSPNATTTDKQYHRRIHTTLFVLLIFLSIVIVEGSTFLAFSPSLQHYPTLPFAALAVPIITILLILFFQQERETIRVAATILLFFMSAIYPQVNSELAANPTQQLDILIYYRIYLHSLLFLAAFCTWRYMFPANTEDS